MSPIKKDAIKRKFKKCIYCGCNNRLLFTIEHKTPSWTDPCLFDWAKDDFKEFKFKWFQEEPRPKVKLPEFNFVVKE